MMDFGIVLIPKEIKTIWKKSIKKIVNMVSNSKILVVGGSGFIGKNLINDLILKETKL